MNCVSCPPEAFTTWQVPVYIVCGTLPALLPAAVGGAPFSNALVSFANGGDFEWLQGHLTLPRGPTPSWWGNPPVCMCQGDSSLHESLFKSLHMVHFVLCCSISLTSICYGVQQKVGLLLIWSWLLERNTSDHLKGRDLGGNGLDIYPVLFNNVKPTFVLGTPVLESYDCMLVFVSWYMVTDGVWQSRSINIIFHLILIINTLKCWLKWPYTLDQFLSIIKFDINKTLLTSWYIAATNKWHSCRCSMLWYLL